MIHAILDEILATVPYWPIAIGIAVLCMITYLMSQRVLGKKVTIDKGFFLTFVWVTYTILILAVTIFSRAEGSRSSGIDFHLFYNPSGSTEISYYSIENLVMFLPYGVLLGVTFPRKVGFRENIMICCGFSVLIEAVQFMTGRGYCQLEDVVLNTLGGLIGWLGVRMAVNLLAKSRRKNIQGEEEKR